MRIADRPVWLSAAGGVSVAYVFVHFLPELAASQAAVAEAAAGATGAAAEADTRSVSLPLPASPNTVQPATIVPATLSTSTISATWTAPIMKNAIAARASIWPGVSASAPCSVSTSDSGPSSIADSGGMRSRSDYAYGYAAALADGIVRPVLFMAYSGDLSWRTSAGDEVSARLGGPMTRDLAGQALQRHPYRGHVGRLLGQGGLDALDQLLHLAVVGPLVACRLQHLAQHLGLRT